MIPPSEFVPIAEESALIERLGEWTLARICGDARAWPDLLIGVNASPAQLRRPDLAERFARIAEESGLSLERVVLEIAEALALECGRHQMEHLDALRAAGVRISVDDFGAGQSSPGYLCDFPIDSLKIDKSFIQGLESSHTSRVFVSAMTHVGHDVGMRVVAEGIETEQQATQARSAGCDIGQGFLFARPMPAEDVAALMEMRAVASAA